MFNVNFNPRTHKECDRLSTNKQRRLYDFNPRTHKECDAFPIALPNCQEIFQSTHSQRVRQIIVFCSLFIEKFQSTHSQRVRLKNLIINTQVILFQSTHSQRVRLQYSNCSIIYPCISIHALTKSATEINFKPHSFNVYFNPRTHKECDPLLLVNVASLTIFQSTHSQRVRLLMHRIYLDTWIISIHALTKSATRWTS